MGNFFARRAVQPACSSNVCSSLLQKKKKMMERLVFWYKHNKRVSYGRNTL